MSQVDLFLQSYCYRHHYLHQPGYDVFAFLDRAAADGFTGVSINMNGPNYRQLSGTSTEQHIRQVRDRLEASKLRCDIETSGTDAAHLATILKVCRDAGGRAGADHMRHAGTPAETIRADHRRSARMRARCSARPGLRCCWRTTRTSPVPRWRRSCAAVDTEPVGVLFDYGNSMMVAEQPETALEAMLPFIRSVHLKDHACRKRTDGDGGDPGRADRQLACCRSPI